MAYDVWLTLVLITCLSMGFRAVADTDITGASAIIPSVHRHLIRGESHHEKIIKRDNETGFQESRMKELDTFFAHPEKLIKNAIEKRKTYPSRFDFGKEILLSELLQGRLAERRDNKVTGTKDRHRKIKKEWNKPEENLHGDVSKLRDWSRRRKANVGGEGIQELNMELGDLGIHVGKDKSEGSKIIKVASLLGHSLESQGTGSTLIKHSDKRLGNRPSAYHYFLPAHPVTSNQKTHQFQKVSRFTFLNSFIKPQLAEIMDDLEGLGPPQNHTKSKSLYTLRAFLKGHQSKSGIQLTLASASGEKKRPTIKHEHRDKMNKGNSELKGKQTEMTLKKDLSTPGTGSKSSLLQNTFVASPGIKTKSVYFPSHRDVTKNEGLVVREKNIKSNLFTVEASDGLGDELQSDVILKSRYTPSEGKNAPISRDKYYVSLDKQGMGLRQRLEKVSDSPTGGINPSLFYMPTKVTSVPRLISHYSLKRKGLTHKISNARYVSLQYGSEESLKDKSTSGSGAEMSYGETSSSGAPIPRVEAQSGPLLAGSAALNINKGTKIVELSGSGEDILYQRARTMTTKSSHNQSNVLTLKGVEANHKGRFRTNVKKRKKTKCETIGKAGMKAIRILAFGDSLTNGFHDNEKHHTPYARRLEYLLNKNRHRCYLLTTVAKDGSEASEMSSRLKRHLQKARRNYSWVIILAGTNDISHNSHVRSRKAWDVAVEHVINLHIASHRHGAKTVVVTIPEMDCEESSRAPCRNTRLERKYINEKLRHYARSNDHTVLCDLALKLPRYTLSSAQRNRLWEVGLHMKAEGYDRMAEIIYKDLLSRV